MARQTSADLFVRFIQQARPLRRMSIFARYAFTVVIVFLCFIARYALGDFYPYPYLLFLPGIIIASFVFDRGSGFLATILSAGLALYFFVEPRTSFALGDIGAALSVGLFTVVGTLTAAIIEALRLAVEELTDSEERLTQSLNLLETVIEGTPDPIFVKDLEGRFVRVNSAMARILGAPREAIHGKTIREFVMDEQGRKTEAEERQIVDARAPALTEELFNVPGQGPRWFLTSKAPWYGPGGKLSGLVGLAQDIDLRKRAEDDVRRANAQKELLLYDINHRVKNHLQAVLGVLTLSRRGLTDEAARASIEAAIGRLSVLARVYDRLQFRNADEAAVDARDFIGGLCSDLEPVLVGLRPITVTHRVGSEMIEIGQAVSVGLLINEALTNALKHGFPDERPGHVEIGFRREDGEFVLEVSDNGVGLAQERRSAGTGTKLIQALGQQLGGLVEWLGPPGTTLRTRFPAQARSSRPSEDGTASPPHRTD